MFKILFFSLVSTFLFGQNKEILEAINFQIEMNMTFADSLKRPSIDESNKKFNGLDFYPITEKYIVEATFKRTKKSKVFKMKTTTARTPLYKKYGELYFSIDGKSLVLSVYQNLELIKNPEYKDYLFLPFSDLTCGNESYIGGRYLDIKIPKSKKIIINFNKAYNPYCAYHYKYSCPIVPLENDLDIEIRAGVKKLHD